MKYDEESVALPGDSGWFGMDVLDALDYAAHQQRCTTRRETLEEAYVSWVHDEVMEERIGIYSPRHQQRRSLLGGFTEPPLVRADIETLINYDELELEVREDAPEDLVDGLVEEAAAYLEQLDF